MATYQKRGGKPKTKKEKEDKIEEESTTAGVFNTLDESASKTEQFVSKYQNIIVGIIIVVIIVVLGYLGYNRFILKPQQEEASNELSQSQNYFSLALETNKPKARDSLFSLAINGAHGKFGFVDIAKEYSSTKAGNLANYYAGISYLNIGDYKNAIDYLQDFKAEDEMISTFALGAIGDAFLQLEQLEDAFEYYKKAANHRDNNYTTPKYLFKAAITAMELKNPDKAIEFLERIEKQYPESEEAKKLKPYLGKAMGMKF
ncbi:tetratricopeptide repeat protein [Psychroflexus sp. MBR-150]|jgi:tetratricopeptide (TPR) repeat protein